MVSDAELRRLFDFEAADLEANANGVLSQRQEARLHRGVSIERIWVRLGTAAAVVGAVLLAILPRDQKFIAATALIVGIVVLITRVPVLRSRRASLVSPSIKLLEGVAKTRYRDSGTGPDSGPGLVEMWIGETRIEYLPRSAVDPRFRELDGVRVRGFVDEGGKLQSLEILEAS